MIPYILKAGIILAGCLIFYKILLQKETFFRLNRWILFICLLISFSLPLIQVPGQWSFRKPAIVFVPVSHPEEAGSNKPGDAGYVAPAQSTVPGKVEVATQPVQKSGTSLQQVLTWAGWLYWFGVAVFGASFLFQIVILLYRAYSRPAIMDGRLRIVELTGDKAPCSFGNIIFINPAKYDWETYQQILLHEKVHILQGHSFDIMLSEIVLIFQWFNPFAWIYRRELEKNLEFLTDDQVLQYPEVERDSYQLSLVKVSAPHFPLNLTTNYNQSLLKKRVAMMNAKKSNMQTAWKYLFLFPLLILFVSLLNEPKAIAQVVTKNKEEKHRNGEKHGMQKEGYWFATIKGDHVNIQFKNEEDDHSYNSNSYLLSELGDIPRDRNGIFTLKRDAGTMEFMGKFEGNQGMGRYKFTPDPGYVEAMKKEGLDISEDDDQMTFFMVNVSRNYLQMLRENGYTNLSKNDVIPLAALQVDAAFIKSMKEAGFTLLSAEELIPLKALGITGEYVREIRNAGYPNITSQQIVSFKAQNIDAKYIADIRNAGGLRRNNGNKENERSNDNERPLKKDISADDIVAIKALDIDPAYIHSLEEVGFKNLDHDQLVPMKAQGITADYIRSWQSAGYKDLSAQDLIGIKAQNITPDYIKSFESVGFKNLGLENAIPLKSMNITPEYVKSFQSAGYSDLSPEKVISLKAQNITPELIKQYKSLGFDNVSLDDIVAAVATGTTPSFITSMREKGHKLRSLDKYIQLRNALEE